MSESKKGRKRRRNEDEQDSEVKRNKERLSSRMNFKPRKSGGGKMPKFLIHHKDAFRYAPEPKDRVPIVKPSTGGTETWTEPTKSRPQTVRVESEPDAEEMLKVLEDHPELFDELSDKLFEKMNEDFESLEREMTKDLEDTHIESQATSEHSFEDYNETQTNSVPLEEVEVDTELDPDDEEVITDTPLETAGPLEADIVEQLESQDLSSLESELYLTELPIESEPPIDYLELQADSFEEYLAEPLEVEQVEEAESGY